MMLYRCDGVGENPYVVNFITFSGHGITFDGDAIAVIPEYEDSKNKDLKVLRFINFSDWARGFAEIKNTLSFFILSMCRIQVDDSNKEKVLREKCLKEMNEDLTLYRFFNEDIKPKYPKYSH